MLSKASETIFHRQTGDLMHVQHTPLFSVLQVVMIMQKLMEVENHFSIADIKNSGGAIKKFKSHPGTLFS
jgi:hypothetical protein